MRGCLAGRRRKNLEQAARAAHDCSQGVESPLRIVAGQTDIRRHAGHFCIRKCSDQAPRRAVRLYAEQVHKWRCFGFGMAAIGKGRTSRTRSEEHTSELQSLMRIS